MPKFYRYKTKAQKAYDLAVKRRKAEDKRHANRLVEIDSMYWRDVKGTVYEKKY